MGGLRRTLGASAALVVLVFACTGSVAAQAVKVTYEPLAAVTDPVAALRADAPQIHTHGNVIEVATGKVDCDLKEVVKFLAPYKQRLERVAVESTYNWYWLVDGLQARRYPVVLANPAGMAQYGGSGK